MELQQFIEKVSLYRPEFQWEYTKGDTPEDLSKKFDLFKAKVRDMSPAEYSFLQWVLWQNFWKPLQRPIEEVATELFLEWMDGRSKAPSALGESDELVRFQSGTSQHRAQKFIECGDGHVWTEDPIGTDDYTIPERVLGLQVSLPHGPRGGIDRLSYYSRNQAERWGDKPVVLTGLIPKRYLFQQKNTGEYAISIKDYDKIVSPEILSVSEYEKKYL